MRFIDLPLAQRLEEIDTRNNVDYARAKAKLAPESGSIVHPIGDGMAVFVGPDLPINRVHGLGMSRDVTTADIHTAREFFSTRSVETRIDLCPLAHRSLREELSRRCCTIDSFKQVFWCSLNDAGDLPTPGNHVRIEQVTDQTALLWAQVVAGSFSGVGRLEDADIRLPRVTPYTRNGVCFLAWIGDDPAGGGALTMQDGAAICYSTSVQPALRRMGVHTALLATRLRYALDAGCDLAVVQTSPGAPSQRNVERFGFRLAYTKATVIVQSDDARQSSNTARSGTQ